MLIMMDDGEMLGIVSFNVCSDVCVCFSYICYHQCVRSVFGETKWLSHLTCIRVSLQALAKNSAYCSITV